MPLNIRPLAAQVDRIEATGLPVHDLLKAAWRLTASGYVAAPVYVEPPDEDRATGIEYQFVSSFRVSEATMASLTRVNDPLGVKSPWSLIRGQVEPLFWKAMDDVLAQVAAMRSA